MPADARSQPVAAAAGSAVCAALTVFAEKTFHTYYEPMRAVRTETHKLIVNFEVSTAVDVPADIRQSPIYPLMLEQFDGIRPPLELYASRTIDGKQHNLADEPDLAAVQADLSQRLLGWMQETDDPLLHGPVASPYLCRRARPSTRYRALERCEEPRAHARTAPGIACCRSYAHQRRRFVVPLPLCSWLLAACQGQPPTPTPAPTEPSRVPSPKPAAALPSPSPSLAVPSPIPSPSPSPSPSPVVAAGADFKIDDYPFAVMIDNIAEARPHFGLASADVVYEAPAEAGIPRLMPIFLRAGGDANCIGPVRSTRHYFVFLANEYRTPLVHIGSSPQGFDALSTTGLADVDESRGDGGFRARRESPGAAQRVRQHASIREVLKQRGGPIKAQSLGPLHFGAYLPGPEPGHHDQDSVPRARGLQRRVRLTTRTARLQADHGRPAPQRRLDRRAVHGDVDRGPVRRCAADPQRRRGSRGRGLVGSGKGVLIADGTQVPLQWSRASVREATQFKRADGAPFVLPNGQVWMQIVPLKLRSTVSS